MIPRTTDIPSRSIDTDLQAFGAVETTVALENIPERQYERDREIDEEKGIERPGSDGGSAVGQKVDAAYVEACRNQSEKNNGRGGKDPRICLWGLFFSGKKRREPEKQIHEQDRPAKVSLLQRSIEKISFDAVAMKFEKTQNIALKMSRMKTRLTGFFRSLSKTYSPKRNERASVAIDNAFSSMARS